MKILQAGALKLGIDLTAGQLSAFETYYAELVAWNKVHHLTAITSYQGVQVKHFLDSLTCVQGLVPPAPSVPTLLPQFPPWRVLDVGSGAGFPGLPLKICFPQFRLTLLEATSKKTAFINHVVQKLGLAEVSVVTGRAEELAHRSACREAFDVVPSWQSWPSSACLFARWAGPSLRRRRRASTMRFGVPWRPWRPWEDSCGGRSRWSCQEPSPGSWWWWTR